MVTGRHKRRLALHSCGVLGMVKRWFFTFGKEQIQHLSHRFCTVKELSIQDIFLLPSFTSSSPTPEGLSQDRNEQAKSKDYQECLGTNWKQWLVGSSFQGYVNCGNWAQTILPQQAEPKWPHFMEFGLGHMICSGQGSISRCDACRCINCVCVIRLAFLWFCHQGELLDNFCSLVQVQSGTQME